VVAAPTAVTVDGNNATKLTDVLGQNNVVGSSVWSYNSPPSGTVNVVATGAAGTDFMLMVVRSYSGVDTAAPFGTPQSYNPVISTANMDVTGIGSDTGQLGALCGAARKGTANTTFSADATSPVSTERADITHSSGSPQISATVYEENGASGTIDMRVDMSENVQATAIGVSILPATASATRQRSAVFYP